MNLTDLRDVLDERSATDHTQARAHLLLDGVHQRLRARARRRRAAAVAAITLAVLAVGVGSLAVARPPAATPVAAGPSAAAMRTIAGFPEYAYGARVLAAASVRPPARSVDVTVVPRSLRLVLFTRCSGAGKRSHTVTLNGKMVTNGDNSDGCGGIIWFSKTNASEYGLRVGEPVTATVTITAGQVDELGLAVGVAVDPSSYPYPPRPAALHPLQLPSVGDLGAGGRIVQSDPAAPQRVVRATLAWPDLYRISLHANSPGALTLHVDGVKVYTGQWWDWAPSGHAAADTHELSRLGLRLAVGQRVTVTVTPERMTGDWALVLDE